MTELKLVEKDGRRWPCTLCGGETDREAITCGTDDRSIIACPDCLKNAATIDDRIERRAARLEGIASDLRTLKGQVTLPTFEAWQNANKAFDACEQEGRR